MKVLVTGAKGQLGADLMNELEKRGLDGIGVDVEEMDEERVIGQLLKFVESAFTFEKK